MSRHSHSIPAPVRRSIRLMQVAALALSVPACLAAAPVEAAPHRAQRSVRQASRGSQVALRPVPLPDGSGSLRLPAGWRIISAQQGMVSAVGPHGFADLGIWVQVYTPEAASTYWARPPLVAAYGDPVAAVRQITPQFMKAMGQSGFRWIRLIDRKPAIWPNGRAAFLHYEWELRGQRLQTVALVILAPVGDGSFLYYTSSITSRSSRFARDFPVLYQIWSSWKVSDGVYRQRLASAMASMRETGRILRAANADRQDAQDRSNLAWSHQRRGTWLIEDRETGRRYEARSASLRQQIERMNREAGYERYHEVPYRDLNR